MKTHDLIKTLQTGTNEFDAMVVKRTFEEARSMQPVIYNIETTNACNMTCKMCPRTTMMSRPIETISRDVFIKIIDQIEPHTEALWAKWKDFVFREYGVMEDDMSENHFFLYIIPKVIQLHGYGDPLLDKNMAEYVQLLNERGFSSYFSCNPANIDLARTKTMLDAGLSYIKYSIESVDDVAHKEIRGEASNFAESFRRILEVLKYKTEKGLDTIIVITMLDLNRTHQQEDFDKLREVFSGLDVYLYLKSEDQQWYRKDYHGTKSVHWSEICKHPWMSMTIKSNGEATMCMEDYNNEIILGDVTKDSLYDIWNGEQYRQFRKDHFAKTRGIKCTEECDMSLVGDCI
jgi:radical SAM protein with 4Fe4S-binding SPASM domain